MSCNEVEITPGEEAVAITDEKDVSIACDAAARMARTLGFSSTDTTSVATAVTELARNILRYATIGKIILTSVTGAGRVGIKITAVDSGPGISDLENILSGNYQSASGLGLGLLGAKRLLDDFHVDTTAGSGTTVTGVKYGR